MRKSFKFIFLGFFILSALSFFGCAGSRKTVWGSPEQGVLVSLHPENGKNFKYEITSDITSTMERNGRSFDNIQKFYMSYTLTAEKPDSFVNFIFIADTGYISFRYGKNKRDIDMSAIFGKRIKISFTPKGKFLSKKTTPIDSIPKPEKGRRRFGLKPTNFIRTGFFELPEKRFKKGESWTETKTDTIVNNDTTRNYHSENIINYENTYTVLGFEEKAGKMCVHIKIESDFTRDMTTTGKNMNSSSEEEGESTTEVWFAYNLGMPVEIQINSFAEGTRAFSGQYSSTMPFSRETKQTVKLVN